MTPRAPRPGAASGIVTLSSDFGLDDPFVGVMTGAVLRHYRGAQVVQLCHGIAPQATREAAFWLERCYSWFPPGTVHVVVVDPEVGSDRAVLAAAIDDHYFVLPDAGLLGPRLLGHPAARVIAVDVSRLGLPRPSSTFHGRDVFAPIAAHIASGAVHPDELGAATRPRASALAPAVVVEGELRGEIAVVDRFGNLISNLEIAEPAPERRPKARLVVGHRSMPLGRTYADAEPGELVAVVNAFGVVEAAVRNGSARETLGVGVGTPVVLTPAPERA